MRWGFDRDTPVSAGSLGSLSAGAPPLRVVDVGYFDASFVPTIRDFERLDERFRLPHNVWDQLPGYRDYGFAVFKLKRGVQPQRVHPMAFSFPRRRTDLLFFPTVHVHDGTVHPEVRFDHELYCQSDKARDPSLRDWNWADGPASDYIDILRTEGIVKADVRCCRLVLRGMHENVDSWSGDIPKNAQRLEERRLKASGVRSVDVDAEGIVTCPGCGYQFRLDNYRAGKDSWRHGCGQALRPARKK
jgi:hypothetical protein